MTNNKITIAIDGYSSCGKSTVAKQIAKKLSYSYVDSGAMYRAVTYYLMKEGILKDKNVLLSQIVDALKKINITFKFDEKKNDSITLLNGLDIENEIRTLEVSKRVSQISALGEVREKLVQLQQELGQLGGVVMDGRDIGTVVFPNAELKLFMTAEVDIRTERRLKELINKNEKTNFDEVKKNLQTRDHLDMNREISPLKMAEDALIIDNSNLTPEEQLEKIMGLVKERLNN